MKTYKRKRLCPKCHVMPGTTEYQEGYHGKDCAFENGARIESYWATMGSRYFGYSQASEETKKKIAENDQAMNDLKDAIPEHFERVCPNCKHRWAEGLD